MTTIPSRHQIVARLKRQDRIGPDGDIISPLFVAELDPVNPDGSITDRDGFDLTVIADERYISVGFWYNDANTPPSFDADNFGRITVDDPFAGLGAAEILEATKVRNRMAMEAIIAETESAIDAAAARLTSGG